MHRASAPHSHSETQDPSVSGCHHLPHPSTESLYPCSTERVCVKGCTWRWCHLYPHSISQKSVPHPLPYKGKGGWKLYSEHPRRKANGPWGIYSTLCHSITSHMRTRRFSQRGVVIILRSHSFPEPRSIDFLPTALIHKIQSASMVGGPHGKMIKGKRLPFTENIGSNLKSTANLLIQAEQVPGSLWISVFSSGKWK